jgi:photosystem II stability/assembly factor-like uncharacterized protein
VLDLAFDPMRGARLYALGQSPRALYVSEDGGATFALRSRFADDGDILKIAVAPSRPDTLYAAGDREGRLLLLRSGDGGGTFVAVAPGAAYADGLPLDLLGVHPGDPMTIFAALRAASGADTVWRSGDGGGTWTRLLSLPTRETLGGFSFGPTGDVLYVGSREQFFQPGAPPGQLYRSTDGGRSWSAPRPSGARGPRYRCLSHRGGRLYACAGGKANGDDFLLGVSSDDGATWTSLMTTDAIAGPEPCARAACTATAAWLCDAYGLCEVDAGPRAPGDGGVMPAPSTGGCGCVVGARGRQPRGGLTPMLATLAWTLLRRRQRRLSRREREKS